MSTAALRVLSCIVCENRALAQIEVEWSTPLGSNAYQAYCSGIA